MNQKELQNFISYLVDNYRVFAPQEEEKQIIIKEITDAKTVAITSQLSFYPWKKILIPEEEILFKYKNDTLTGQENILPEKIALFGINILDLRAILLYDAVFSNDPYYQNRRKNSIIIGYGFKTILADGEERKINETELKNLPFDIFINEALDIFTGTEKGKKLLEKIDFRDYKFIGFEDQKYNKFLEDKMNLRRDKLKNKHNQKIWDELGKICIECGKCVIACPTCFCFRIDDQPKLSCSQKSETGQMGDRNRCWDSCYYQEFSEVAGSHKFLSNTAQKIHFWYYHKFARIPDEHNMMGCVGCHRCHAVCPVGINIEEIMKQVEES
jgi:sulfhydrogenase subunit beta (sulfur reductase)